ncbi:MAG: hypothetical protein VX438_00200, partial [Planctomycetota bacterium]|nr:hypothetical protein [Planctomycetota bacterium]
MNTGLKTVVLGIGLISFGFNAIGQDTALPQGSENSVKTLALSANGSLIGKLSTALSSFDVTVPAEKLHVSLSRNGKMLHATQTDHRGRFELKDIQTGRYNFLAFGETALFVTGIDIVENDGLDVVAEMVAMPAPLKVAKTVLTSHSKSLMDSIPVKVQKSATVSVRSVAPIAYEGDVSGR